MYNDSDEYDFNPASSAKLATLFGNAKIQDSFNASLTYTAPKQPKAKKEQDFQESQSVKNKPTTSVLLAKIVSLWKLEVKDYKTLGKHGLAVIGSIEHNLYEVIAYKEKNNILLRKKINSSFSFYNKKDYFSTLYDNDNQNWLVKFENADDQTTFCQTIKKYGAKIIDKIEETLKNNDEIQANPEKESKPELPASTIKVLEKEPEIHSDSSGSQKRATILSRMARMGQQILPSPLVKNTSTDMSDSELDDTKDDRKVPPRKVKRAGHTEKAAIPKEEKLPQAVQHGYIETQMVPSQSYNFNPQNLNYPMHQPNVVSPVYYNQPMQYDGFTNFILTQNTELKMNLSQISAKLDCVLSQGNAGSPKSEDANLKSKIKALELKSENLQSELEAYERRYSELERMYEELKGRIHQDTIENREHEAVIQDLRVEVVKLNEKIRENDDKISDTKKLEHEIEQYRNETKEYEKTIEEQKARLNELEKFYEQNKDNTNLEATVESLNETISSLKMKLKELEEYYQKSEEEKQNQIEKNNKMMDQFSEKIKQHMNSMYQSILANFNEDTSYSMADINSNIARGLKSTTFKIIDDLKLVHNNECVE